MVEPVLYAALGACLATLVLLLFLPLFWRRAVRLTTKRLAGRLPISVSEIVAAQDRLRAEHAMATRAVERRAEIMTADAARERVEAGKFRSEELAVRAENAQLRDVVRVLEEQGAVVRGDLDRTGAEFAATVTALATARSEAAVAARERDAARKLADAAEGAADDLRIDLAAMEAALASAQAETSDAEKRLGQSGQALTAKERHEDELGALLRTESSRVADANAARLTAEKRLVDETARVVALRAELARAGAHAVDGAPKPDDLLVALRTRLDEVADDIVRAAAAPATARSAEAMRPRAAQADGGRLETLLPSHA